MVKKVSLAAAMIHSPAVLVLDEPFESVDPVSTAQAVDLLKRFAGAGGTVMLSSHNMNLVERVCDTVAVIVGGRILAAGTLDEVRGDQSLEERFVELAGGRIAVEGLEWLTTFSDRSWRCSRRPSALASLSCARSAFFFSRAPSAVVCSGYRLRSMSRSSRIGPHWSSWLPRCRSASPWHR
jgi:ABC-type sulfate/molybdate transport systems ATPase subunit